jgi:hypothetical protein
VIRTLARRAIDGVGRVIGPNMQRLIGRSDVIRRLVLWARSPDDDAVAEAALEVIEVEREALPVIPVEMMGVRPSFRYKLEELKRQDDALKGQGIRDPLNSINDKYRAYAFADTHGIDHPRLIGLYDSIDGVIWEEMPERFVLKTRWGTSNHGVKPLVREGPGAFYDLIRSRSWTVEEIHDHQALRESQGLVSKAMFAEELILKPETMQVVDDWKFYCFDGEVGLCMQKDMRASADPSQWRFKFWDRDWNDLGPIKYADRVDQDLAPPSDPTGLFDMAERLSAIIERPFIRIDLFESERGPVFVEFTPRPAPPQVFVAEVDEMLGRFWEEAEQRIFAREITAGSWDHIMIE